MQLFIHANGLVRVQFNAQRFQAKAGAIGHPAQRAKDLVKFDRDGLAGVFTDEPPAAVFFYDLARPMPGADIHPFLLKTPLDQPADVGIFPREEPRLHLDLGDPAAEPLKGLRQFTADRPTAQRQQALRQFAQLPEIVRA